MEENEIQPLERNPKTHAAHKREAFWQITFPLILGLIFILAPIIPTPSIVFNSVMALLTVMAATGDGRIAQAGDTALIFLIVPLMLTTFVSLIIFAAIAYGVFKLTGVLPGYTKQAQDALEQVRRQVQVGSDKVVEPVLKIRSFLASFEALKRK